MDHLHSHEPAASNAFFEAGASTFVSKVAAAGLLSITRLCIDRV
jgi:hypothetical protein